MRFKPPSRAGASTSPQRAVVNGVRGCIVLAGRLTLSLATLLVIACALLYLRLMQGPLELPALAEIAERVISEQDHEYVIEIGNIVLKLQPDDGDPFAQFEDVTVRNRFGNAIFQLPRVRVAAELRDLVTGDVHPSEILVRGPEVSVTRDLAGLLRLRIGEGAGVPLAAPGTTDGPAGDDAEQIERIVAALAGEIEGPAFLSELEGVRIDDAKLVYNDHILGSSWVSPGAIVELVRFDGGVRAVVSASTIEGGVRSASVRLIAERLKGREQIELRASFGEIRTSVLAAQLPALAWVNVLEGGVEGRAEATLDNRGVLTRLAGTIISEKGRLRGLGDNAGFDTAELSFEMDPERDLVTLSRAVLSSRSVDTALSGVAQIRRDPSGAMADVAGQLSLDRLYADLPQTFSDPLNFSSGEVSFRWALGENMIEVTDSALSNGDLVFTLDGRAVETEAGWITDFRAEAQNMDVEGLLAHWPLVAAANARDWIASGITAGEVPSFLAQMRIGGGDPHLSLDFEFEGLSSIYLDGMSPIENASGRGHMSYHDISLEIDEAEIVPSGGDPIALDGSTIVITDFWGEVTPAYIEISAAGGSASILDLIDEQPLGLISKLGVALGRPTGSSEVKAVLDFPLINDLLLEEIKVDGKARIVGLQTTIALPGRAPLDVRGENLRLSADIEGLRLQGGVAVNGMRGDLDWREDYGSNRGSRSVSLRTDMTTGLARELGAPDLPVEGSIPIEVILTQTDGQPVGFTIRGDLTPAEVVLDAIGWRKERGTPGQVTARGTITDGVRIDNIDASAAGLSVKGRASISESGAISELMVDRLTVPGVADVGGSMNIAPDGIPELKIERGTLDISSQIESLESEGSGGRPIRITFDLDRMVLSESIAVTGARGSFAREPSGKVDVAIKGALGGVAEIDLALEKPANAQGRLVLSSPNAGAALGAADVYRGAEGGVLILEAIIGGPGEPTLTGSARIDNLVVKSQSTFRRVLDRGGLEEAGQEVERSGIGFRKIRVPFIYDEATITFSDAIATSPALALKVSGTLNEETEALDLAGVLSPAYALTGALNEIPVLGELLSGGEGEGILAMTFRIEGEMRDPSLSVNPLSILTPGFLRKIFEGEQRETSPGFQERINQGADR